MICFYSFYFYDIMSQTKESSLEFINDHIIEIIVDNWKEMKELSNNYTTFETFEQVEFLIEIEEVLELIKDLKEDESAAKLTIIKEKYTEFLTPENFTNEGVYLDACNSICQELKRVDQLLTIIRKHNSRWSV